MNAHELARDIFTRNGNGFWMTRKQTSWMFSMFKAEISGMQGAHRTNSNMGGAFEVNGVEYSWAAHVNPNGCALLNVQKIEAAPKHIEEIVLAYRELRKTVDRKGKALEMLEEMFPQYSEDQIIESMI